MTSHDAHCACSCVAAVQVHKVGGTTLRQLLLRVASGANATVGVLGCTAQREPLRAHLSASHVVCPGPTRCAQHSGAQRFCALLLHALTPFAPLFAPSSATPQGLRAGGAAGAQPLRGAPHPHASAGSATR